MPLHCFSKMGLVFHDKYMWNVSNSNVCECNVDQVYAEMHIQLFCLNGSCYFAGTEMTMLVFSLKRMGPQIPKGQSGMTMLVQTHVQ